MLMVKNTYEKINYHWIKGSFLRKKTSQICVLLLSWILAQGSAMASDHVDGEMLIAHPVIDITDLYAFPSPEHEGRLVLVANIYPFVPRSGHFSDRVRYDFILYPTAIDESQALPAFKLGTEARISCQFETPEDKHEAHWVSCKSPHISTERMQVGEIQTKMPNNGLRVFAGHRADPFFFNRDWVEPVLKEKILPEPTDANVFKDMNVLSIVLEIDLARYFVAHQLSLLSVAAETHINAKTITDDVDNESPTETATKTIGWQRVDYLGRAEITNIALHHWDSEPDLRTTYNQEISSGLDKSKLEVYRQRLRQNIQHYDQLDGQQDWQKTQAQQYAELLLHDYLVIDVSGHCDASLKDGYLALEHALLRGEKTKHCGGRQLEDDIVDILFTDLIRAGLGQGERIRDGVDHAYRKNQPKFPYLAEPNMSYWAALKAWLIRLFIN